MSELQLMIFGGVLRSINYYSKVETPILMRIAGHKKETTFLEYIGENFNQDHYADLFIQQISS